ncbi:hypothetical protein TYRP_006941 [Tyrophagus putrescentiae]|nr:hypothetical protein TYRP_006941 [Tyrophagus putrescentiae]
MEKGTSSSLTTIFLCLGADDGHLALALTTTSTTASSVLSAAIGVVAEKVKGRIGGLRRQHLPRLHVHLADRAPVHENRVQRRLLLGAAVHGDQLNAPLLRDDAHAGHVVLDAALVAQRVLRVVLHRVLPLHRAQVHLRRVRLRQLNVAGIVRRRVTFEVEAETEAEEGAPETDAEEAEAEVEVVDPEADTCEDCLPTLLLLRDIVLAGHLKELQRRLLQIIAHLLDLLRRLIVLVGEHLARAGNLLLQLLVLLLRQLVLELLHLRLGVVNDALRLVHRLHQLAVLPVRLGKLLRILDHILNVVLGEAAARLNDNLLLLAGALVPRGDVHDAVRVNVKGDLNLGDAAGERAGCRPG